MKPHYWPGRRALAAAATTALLVIVGCPPTPPAPTSDTIGIASIAEGLTSPVTMAVPPDSSGRLFIVDQVGTVRVLDANGTLLDAPFLDVRDRMVQLNPAYDERGLLGMAFHPGFATNRRFFVMYNAPPAADLPAGFNTELHISEFLASANNPNQADAASERVVLRIPKPQSNHNGGTVVFGPDGFLYISVGDGGGENDTAAGHTPGIGNAQDLGKLLGKILRIDVDAGQPYAVPADNPFVGVANAAPEIWALGLRNPYRISFDRNGGRLFAGEVGQALFEEVDIITREGNYGWFIREADSCFNPANNLSPLPTCADTGPSGIPFTDPIVSYPHSGPSGTPVGTAVVGGYVYRGSLLGNLQGQYIFGDFSSPGLIADGLVWAAAENADGTWTMRELAIAGSTTGRLGRRVLGFGEDASGELYVLTTMNTGPAGNTGIVYRIGPPTGG